MKTILLAAALAAPAQAAPRGTVLMVTDGLGAGALAYAVSLHEKTGVLAIPNVRAFLRSARGGLVRTEPARDAITDSAAAATAMACGVKTRNRSVGVDEKGRRLPCLGEKVKKAGLALGLVTTADVRDATPAAFSAHVRDRDKDKEEIGRQQEALAPEVREGNVADLEKAAREALVTVAKDPEGFFLLLETERTDDTGHANDLPGLLRALEEFDRALSAVLEFQKANPHVTVLWTSDHDTGGLGVYPDRPTPSWLTRHHTGTPVGIFGTGPGAASLPALMDNTEIFELLRSSLGI